MVIFLTGLLAIGGAHASDPPTDVQMPSITRVTVENPCKPGEAAIIVAPQPTFGQGPSLEVGVVCRAPPAPYLALPDMPDTEDEPSMREGYVNLPPDLTDTTPTATVVTK